MGRGPRSALSPAAVQRVAPPGTRTLVPAASPAEPAPASSPNASSCSSSHLDPSLRRYKGQRGRESVTSGDVPRARGVGAAGAHRSRGRHVVDAAPDVPGLHPGGTCEERLAAARSAVRAGWGVRGASRSPGGMGFARALSSMAHQTSRSTATRTAGGDVATWSLVHSDQCGFQRFWLSLQEGCQVGHARKSFSGCYVESAFMGVHFPYSTRSWEREIAAALPLPLPVGQARRVGPEV